MHSACIKNAFVLKLVQLYFRLNNAFVLHQFSVNEEMGKQFYTESVFRSGLEFVFLVIFKNALFENRSEPAILSA